MKNFKMLFLVLVLSCVTPNISSAADHHEATDVLLDVGLRYVSFVGTLVGTGLYIAISPFTAISYAITPDDSFQDLAEVMIIEPAKYTFDRPMGVYTYGVIGDDTYGNDSYQTLLGMENETKASSLPSNPNAVRKDDQS